MFIYLYYHLNTNVTEYRIIIYCCLNGVRQIIHSSELDKRRRKKNGLYVTVSGSCLYLYCMNSKLTIQILLLLFFCI